MLSKAGVDVTVPERGGRRLTKDTPADIAEKMGRQDNATYLKELSVAINAVKFAAKMKKGAAAKKDAATVLAAADAPKDSARPNKDSARKEAADASAGEAKPKAKSLKERMSMFEK